MESGSSFSIGLSQLHASTPIEVDVEFVPGEFDYEDSDFRENRYKHRNDPTMMKKLLDAVNSKGKKTIVVVSKRRRKKLRKEIHNQRDCGVFVAAFAEFLSDRMQILSSHFDVGYHLKRYATLLCNYEVKKANKVYISDHDDPSKPQPNYASLIDDFVIIFIE
ncbi:hypothetical protein FXO37_17066 [Capsicum annuum]|nr:hypothetical protein FXO37_17066 [Capsicum annuum]